MSDIILKVENISKQYRLGVVGTGTISHDLNRWWYKVRGKEDPFLKIGESNDRATKGDSDYVWALKDINFEVKRGEVLGIIGKNGAGKSTLLKILSKVTAPTTGIIKSKGRIASLLEVGTGFHPEMTGKENIFLNGAILGMTKKEISAKLDEIVSFSGCERYIDTPVKRYSSGMKVRLAFAVAAHLEPDILVVDEVLAVGDAEFQKKAIGKMQDISNTDGRTVLFVSHDMVAIQNLCSRSVLLDNGFVKLVGETELVVKNYLESSYSRVSSNCRFKLSKCKSNSKTYFDEVILKNYENRESSEFFMGDEFCIIIKVKNIKLLKSIKVSIIIKNLDNIKILAYRTHEMLSNKLSASKDFVLSYTVKNNFLMPGKYLITLALANLNDTIQIVEDQIIFDIIPKDIYKTGRVPKGKIINFSYGLWDLKEL